MKETRKKKEGGKRKTERRKVVCKGRKTVKNEGNKERK